MELSWSTFVLEIVNFLVLVWILKHFLYRPVLEVIARRRAGIEKTMSDAESLHAEAQSLQEKYEGRLAEWERERQQARDALAGEIEAERARKMSELQSALEQEREKARVAAARRQADAVRRLEETALEQGARFATQLLQQAAGPDMEARLVELAITGLSGLTAERVAALRNSYGKTYETVRVATAFDLPGEQRAGLEQALANIAGPDIPVRFEQDTELIAGIHITIGAWVLDANLRDELQGFRKLAHDA